MAKTFFKRLIISIVGKSVGNVTFSCTSGGNVNWWNLLERPFGSTHLKKHSYPLTQHFHCLEFIPREHAHKSTGPADGGIVYTSKNWKPPKYPSIGDELNNSHSAAQWNPYCSTWISNRHLNLSMPRENLFPGPHQTAPPTSSPWWQPASSPPSCLGQTLHTRWSPLPLAHIPLVALLTQLPLKRKLASSKPNGLPNGLCCFYSRTATVISQDSSQSNHF